MRAIEDRLKALMLRGLDGDVAAHRQLLAELAGVLRRYYARALRGNMSDAEDLVQETLIAVHTRRDSYDPTQPFTPWAFAMARYKRIDLFRRRRIRAAAPLDEIELKFGLDNSEAVEAVFDLDHLMADLPERERTVIRHVKLEGLSVAEAAERTGLSEAYVKVSVHRGLKKLMARVRGSGNQGAD